MPSPTGIKVVAFGGTGKTVALIYIKLCRIIGYQPDVVVVDLPAGNDANSNDGQLDSDLDHQSDVSITRLNTFPINQAITEQKFSEMFHIPPEVADALFTMEQQNIPVKQGLNAQPQIGSCVAHLKLLGDGPLVSNALLGGPELYFVAGLGGGTGAGVAHEFARFVKEAGQSVHGVYLLPWRDIGANGTVTNAQQMRNAGSLLSYLRDNSNDLYNDFLVLGGTPGTHLYKGSEKEKHRATYPALILAALYLILRQQWGAGAQLVMPRRRLESPAGGIRLQDIETPTAHHDLYDMMLLSRRKSLILDYLAGESPDQLLAWFSLAPLSRNLACASLCWVLKIYAKKTSRHDYSMAWNSLGPKLREIAARERTNLEWIIDLASNPDVFQFDRTQFERDVKAGFDSLLETVRTDTAHKSFSLDRAATEQEALTRSVDFFERRTHELLLQAHRP